MNDDKTLFFVGAHPDDETLGVGGTLTQYAAAGIRVYYLCATKGEVGLANLSVENGHDSLGDTRWEELKCAANILGLTDTIYLGYRDSGMLGSEYNKHPDALVEAPLKQVTSRIVKAIRRLKPQVVVTFNSIGGYRHPDHIVVHKATVEAFYAAGDPNQYPDAGPAFKPQKLYFTIFSPKLLKIAVKLLPLFGQDPHRFGQNKDVDIASIAKVDFPVHTAISLTKQSIEKRNKATACHASQSNGGPPRKGLLKLIGNILGKRDLYMRAYPPADRQLREKDLFDGLT
jgi:N-acetyl-1-D-myo-inositol-2-amino-2-deoxy-alpha-D-glucopyranoside deacetylase/mycothiol S-conjugate amidase